MKLFTKITDLLFRKQKVLELIAVFLFFSLIAFKFDSRNIKLLWSDYPSIAIILAFIISLIAIIWIKIERQKTSLLITNLKERVEKKSDSIETKLKELSPRQKEVLSLIVKGKSNKEIMAELNIELSTLKTHINQVYKILGIKNRREIQQLDNLFNSKQ